ncbi:MAG: pirin family protein [Acidimicrobiia bacterium]|nr:pirin family protein [Acidimicrobiia bacterium]
MIARRPAHERGRADFGWLDSRHTFSFGEYYDPRYMGFRALRVINEDRVKPGHGFGTHPHRDMEIVSYVLEGELAHRDSMGTGSVIRPGDVQRMSAGTGVLHSEMNPSATAPVHFLQIWLLPEARGIEPSYEQKRFEPHEKQGRLTLIASREARDGAITIHQDVDLYAGLFKAGEGVRFALRSGRHAWIQVAQGSVILNGETLQQGDGAAVVQEDALDLQAPGDAEILVFDLA